MSIQITNYVIDRILRHQLGFLRVSLTGRCFNPRPILTEAPIVSLENAPIGCRFSRIVDNGLSPPSKSSQIAVDRQHRPGHAAGFGGIAQEGDDFGHIGGRGAGAQMRGGLAQHVGVHRARRDAVDPDVALLAFGGQRLGQAGEGEFADGVSRVAGKFLGICRVPDD